MDQNFNNGNGAPQNGGFEQGNYNAPQGNYGAPSSFDFKSLLKTEYLIGLSQYFQHSHSSSQHLELRQMQLLQDFFHLQA